jgi:putative membrane protein insertion efficiency factor
MTTVTTSPVSSTSASGPSLEVPTATNRRPWSRRGALFLLKAYQGAASGRVSSCRYYPSCSNYAVEAFSLHGFWRAFGLTARRLLRCRPFGPHGIDLVPLPDGAAHRAAHPHECDLAPECEAVSEHVAQAGQFIHTHEAAEATQATEVRQPC